MLHVNVYSVGKVIVIEIGNIEFYWHSFIYSTCEIEELY